MSSLRKVYYKANSSGSYGGVNRLKKASEAPVSKVKKWLKMQDAYTLHAPVIRKFHRRRTIVSGPYHQYQMDLIDLSRIKKENDGHVFILTCIDVFSKMGYAVPLKNKTSAAMIEGFEEIMRQAPKPMYIQSDKGTEFLNRPFQKMLKDENIRFFTSENEDIKCSIVERFNKNLKGRLYRYFTKHDTLRYIDILQDMIKGYNRSYHRSIKLAPIEVDAKNQEQVWHNLYEPRYPKPCHLQVGDHVRISKARRSFQKGYLPGWSQELFTVSHVLNTEPVTYKIKEENGDEIDGSFYERELQKVKNKSIFKIENVLQKKKNQILVKWLGYPASYNSWISTKQLRQYR